VNTEVEEEHVVTKQLERKRFSLFNLNEFLLSARIYQYRKQINKKKYWVLMKCREENVRNLKETC
jgi:hypothetical protein